MFDPSRYPGNLDEPLAPQTGLALQPRTSRTTAPGPAIDLDANPIGARRDEIAYLTPVSATNVDAGPRKTHRDVIASHTPVPATNVDAWLSTIPSDAATHHMVAYARGLRNHCPQNDWRLIGRPNRCYECHNTEREDIYQCRLCELQSCANCRANRRV